MEKLQFLGKLKSYIGEVVHKKSQVDGKWSPIQLIFSNPQYWLAMPCLALCLFENISILVEKALIPELPPMTGGDI